MAQSKHKELQTDLLQYLRASRPIVLSTVNSTCQIYARPIYWLTAKDSKHIRFAIERKSSALRNLKLNSQVFINVLGDNIIYGISGVAKVLKEKLTAEGEHAMIEVTVKEIRNQLQEEDKEIIEVEGPWIHYRPGHEVWAKTEKAIFRELMSYT